MQQTQFRFIVLSIFAAYVSPALAYSCFEAKGDVGADAQEIRQKAADMEWIVNKPASLVASSGSSEAVRWSPGIVHPRFAFVHAADQEGMWQPAPGYMWETPGTLVPVKWLPGILHTRMANLIAGATPANWQPASKGR